MQEAFKAVKDGEQQRNMEYVPRQTLNDGVSGRVVHGRKPGPLPYLSPPEEAELPSFLVNVAKA